jgi:hypothetical protein
MAEQINSGGKIYFGSWFQSFHSMVGWLALHFWVRQSLVAEGCVGEELLTLP